MYVYYGVLFLYSILFLDDLMNIVVHMCYFYFLKCDELLHSGLKLLVNMKPRECLQLQDETHHSKGLLVLYFMWLKL